MKLARLTHDPTTLADFFDEALASLGALCDREWHDRLTIMAEGAAARLWNEAESLHEAHLRFLPAEGAQSGTPPDVQTDVFPGCPLTFRLAEAVRPNPLSLERGVLATDRHARLPDSAAMEKLWHAQHPGTRRWRMTTGLKRAWHFSLIALVRCETQSIDQHWSLHRLALSLPDGTLDESLASSLETTLLSDETGIPWPALESKTLNSHLMTAIQSALADDLAQIKTRQERYLRREFERINDYFTAYEAELNARSGRSRTADAQSKLEARLAATRVEREHRRRDQCARHEIKVIPHIDSLLLLAEPVHECSVSYHSDHAENARQALFIPRSRRWLTD